MDPELRGEEIDQWFDDNIRTLKVLKEQKAEIFKQLYAQFLSEVEFLYKQNRIDEESVEFVKNEQNFDF